MIHSKYFSVSVGLNCHDNSNLWSNLEEIWVTFTVHFKKKGTAECSVRSALLAGENGGKFHTFFEAVIPVMN